ncbi:MAG: hypothetical protein RTU92_02485 [Candidatus Thorarchaeota archaeon]
MSTENRRSIVLLALLPVIGLVISLVYAFGFSDWANVTPLFGLPAPYRFLLVAFAIPMVGSIVAAILIPRIVAPLFLRIKGKIMPGYKNAYISITSRPLQLRRWLGRALLTALLILGLISILVNVIDPLLFMNIEQYTMFSDLMGFPQLSPSVTLSLAGFVAPIAFGLWAASWAMEDAGLMHYNLPESGDEHLYEIEPVYRRYSSYLKGYAGLASLIFISWTLYLLSISPLNFQAVIFTLLMPVFSILQTIPGYFVYSRLNTSFLTSNLSEINRVVKADLIQ